LKYQFWTESVHTSIWSSSLIQWVLCCATRHEPIILIEIQIGNHKGGSMWFMETENSPVWGCEWAAWLHYLHTCVLSSHPDTQHLLLWPALAIVVTPAQVAKQVTSIECIL
jgi:hypothetical protein